MLVERMEKLFSRRVSEGPDGGVKNEGRDMQQSPERGDEEEE